MTTYNPCCDKCKTCPGLNKFISKKNGKLTKNCVSCREKVNAQKRDARKKKAREQRQTHRKSVRDKRIINLRKGMNVVNLKIITPYSLQMVLMHVQQDDT